MEPTVSIIVPVYNGEQFIEECVESILSQTLSNFELIIVNDGSVDNTRTICNKLSKQDERIQVIHKSNGGPGSARNTGIKNSRGEYIGFVDCDDTLEKDMYKKMYCAIRNNNADICLCGYKELSNKGVYEAIHPLNGKLNINDKIKIQEEMEISLVHNNILGYASLCNKLYNREFIMENNLLINENVRIAEDQCFNLRAFSCASHVCAINEALYLYRRINDKSIMSNKRQSFYLHLEGRKEIIHTLSNINIGDAVFKHCVKYENSKTVSQYLSKIVSVYFSKVSPKVKLQKINSLIHESYFLNAINDFSGKELLMKANLVLKILGGYLFLERNFKRVLPYK
ncbi:glycosyltransferase family 2 protein [Virgibacillus doumboii]|uniref:glycosyltransferase family 2 protein n=1 Tax=Virgibacillus doumboii TaxID=2697503 RepID=UPI0013E0A69A|nr:glycosyltransferase family 2 protein [Virgibacillus doumboii]